MKAVPLGASAVALISVLFVPVGPEAEASAAPSARALTCSQVAHRLVETVNESRLRAARRYGTRKVVAQLDGWSSAAPYEPGPCRRSPDAQSEPADPDFAGRPGRFVHVTTDSGTSLYLRLTKQDGRWKAREADLLAL